ncbi:flavodoxin [Blautia sp. Sow4_E7]|uniref:flavodoxin n=1 Tax=Blautia sp. Sow4_E7 TaxID=3438749 RepID=UPI003F9168B3
MDGKVTDASDLVTEGEKSTKSLVVYFSRMGEIPGELDAVSSATVSSNSQLSGSDSDAQAAAKMIQQLTGADLYQVKTDRYYRKSFMGTAARAWIENTFDLRPALAAKPENLDQYDTIYVGYPIWWFNAPMAIGTLLESYELSGNLIKSFCSK